MRQFTIFPGTIVLPCSGDGEHPHPRPRPHVTCSGSILLKASLLAMVVSQEGTASGRYRAPARRSVSKQSMSTLPLFRCVWLSGFGHSFYLCLSF